MEGEGSDDGPGRGHFGAEAMARAWARRKANAAAESAWWQQPVCLCGCGEALARDRNPERQRLFKPGHDGRLKSVAAGIVAGEVPKHAIPYAARVSKKRIGSCRLDRNWRKRSDNCRQCANFS